MNFEKRNGLHFSRLNNVALLVEVIEGFRNRFNTEMPIDQLEPVVEMAVKWGL